MLSKTMTARLNDQIKWEMYSAYLYLAMSAWLADKGLPGCANWMRVQAQEEMAHAMKFYDFIIERGGVVALQAIDQPPATWKDVMAIFKQAQEHEGLVTARINDLANVAVKDKDHATGIFLQWFVTEQVEEEASVQDVIQKLKLIEGATGAMFMLDKELGARVFTPPAAA